MADKVRFIQGQSAQYDALAVVNENAIYFITDTRKIYKGSVLIASDTVEFVSAVPTVANSVEGKLYVATVNGKTTLHIRSGSSIVQVGGGEATQVADGAIVFSNFNTNIIADAINEDDPSSEKFVTENAVVDFVADKISSAMTDVESTFEGVVSDVTAQRSQDNKGSVLTFTFGTADGAKTTKDITISDLFLSSAEYDSDTHILSLYIQDDQLVEVNLEDLVPQAVNTAQVGMQNNIIVTVDIGNFKKGDTISKDDITNLQAFLEAMLSKDSLPTVTQPYVTLTEGPTEKSYEVGTPLKVVLSAQFDPGQYSQTANGDQVDSGVSVTRWYTGITGNGAPTISSPPEQEGGTTYTADFGQIVITDDTDLDISIVAQHTAGNVPKSFLGRDEVDGKATSAVAIRSGSKSKHLGADGDEYYKIRSHRYSFYEINSQIYHPNMSDVVEDGVCLLVEEPVIDLPNTITATYMQEMVFAVPATKASKLTIVGASPPAPQTVHGPISMKIGSTYDGSQVIDYNVFYVQNAAPTSGTDTYTLTWE